MRSSVENREPNETSASPNPDSVADIEYDKKYLERLTKKGRLLGRHRRWFFSAYLGRRLRKYPKGSTLLDVGFGNGYFLSRFEEKYRTVGLDISYDGIQSVREICPGTAFVQASADDLPVRDNAFDIILALDIVEHLQSPERFLANANRALRPGGMMFISTPNPGSLGARTKGEDWAGHRDPTHIGVRAPQEWRKMLEANGFTIEREGADFLWDIPYPVPVPKALQKLLLIPPRLAIDFLFGFLPWTYGENYYFIVRQST